MPFKKNQGSYYKVTVKYLKIIFYGYFSHCHHEKSQSLPFAFGLLNTLALIDHVLSFANLSFLNMFIIFTSLSAD